MEGKLRRLLLADLGLTALALAASAGLLVYLKGLASFGGFAALAMMASLLPGLLCLLAEALYLCLGLRGKRQGARTAFLLQAGWGVPATLLLLWAPGFFWSLGVHTLLLAVGLGGLALLRRGEKGD